MREFESKRGLADRRASRSGKKSTSGDEDEDKEGDEMEPVVPDAKEVSPQRRYRDTEDKTD